jgi:hypothetical protein
MTAATVLSFRSLGCRCWSLRSEVESGLVTVLQVGKNEIQSGAWALGTCKASGCLRLIAAAAKPARRASAGRAAACRLHCSEWPRTVAANGPRRPCASGFGHLGGQLIPIRTDGGLALLLPGSPGQMGDWKGLQLYFACILPRHSQTPRTINRILTQCLSSLRP